VEGLSFHSQTLLWIADLGYDPEQFWEKGPRNTPDLFQNSVSKLLLSGRPAWGSSHFRLYLQ